MRWNEHPELDGKHAFLGASQHAWVNYDNATLVTRYANGYSQTLGTVLHALAADLISTNTRLPEDDRTVVLFELRRQHIPAFAIDLDFIYPNLRNYVNDAISFRMSVERKLKYSDDAFGTADAISFVRKRLRIHDYKSGITPASMEQLLNYAALFCLEYKVDPNDISVELRIYQAGNVIVDKPSASEINSRIMRYIDADKTLTNFKDQEG